MDFFEDHLLKLSRAHYKSYYSQRNLNKVPTRRVVTDGRQRPVFNDDPFYEPHEDEIVVQIEMINSEVYSRTVKLNRTGFDSFLKILAKLIAKDGIDVEFSNNQKIKLLDNSGNIAFVDLFDNSKLLKHEQQILYEVYDNIWRMKKQSKDYDFNGFLNEFEIFK